MLICLDGITDLLPDDGRRTDFHAADLDRVHFCSEVFC